MQGKRSPRVPGASSLSCRVLFDRMFSPGPCGPTPGHWTGNSGPSGDSTPTVVVMGMTGDGKSNLCTWLTGNHQLFPVSNAAESCTERPVAALGNCFGNFAGYKGKWLVVDTPGLSDSAGRDAQNLRNTIHLLKSQVKQVTTFVLVVNAQQDRMSAALKNNINVFRGCFGSSMLTNLCVVFTKWDWGKKYGQFTLKKLQQRRAEWTKWFAQCEVDYAGEVAREAPAEIQIFAVDLPPLDLVLQDGGHEEVTQMLQESSSDRLSTTGEQIERLYNHIYVVMSARRPVSMQMAEARTENLLEEIRKNLEEEKVKSKELAEKTVAAENKLKEAEAKRAQADKDAKAAEAKRVEIEKQAWEDKKKADLEAHSLRMEGERLRLAKEAAEKQATEDKEKADKEAERLRKEAQRARDEAAVARRQAAQGFGSIGGYCGGGFHSIAGDRRPQGGYGPIAGLW